MESLFAQLIWTSGDKLRVWRRLLHEYLTRAKISTKCRESTDEQKWQTEGCEVFSDTFSLSYNMFQQRNYLTQRDVKPTDHECVPPLVVKLIVQLLFIVALHCILCDIWQTTSQHIHTLQSSSDSIFFMSFLWLEKTTKRISCAATRDFNFQYLYLNIDVIIHATRANNKYRPTTKHKPNCNNRLAWIALHFTPAFGFRRSLQSCHL